jgi:Mannosylglycerate hydrolase MGH1-like glycoside hydrolase domain
MSFRLRRVRARSLARHREMSPEDRRHSVEAASRRILERNWVPTPGFTMPNRRKYPWQWLWDSCFHAIAWSRLGDPRGVKELESVLALQLPSGFVPHMGYWAKPAASLALWHVLGRSDITQPPMYGHALRLLAERGFAVANLQDAATAGLNYLLEHRRDPGSGLIRVVHPWETGCDDSPRWDGWHAAPFKERRWNAKKRELVRSIRLRDGAAWANPGFDVGSSGFSALVAFNARELAELTGNADLLSNASAVARAIDAHWLSSRRTWSDVCLAGPQSTSAVRTLDALFPVLVSENPRYLELAFAEIFEPRCFWRPFGPSGTSADEPTYDPGRYWRGDAWPQEIYLLMVAATRSGRHVEAERLAETLVQGCVGSGYAERWNPDTGAGLGAIPQGWAALACEANARCWRA